jgi:predicted nuclease of predicted toxin-antitoxin system
MPWKELDEPTDDDRRELDLEYRGKARFLIDESAGIGVAKILMGDGYNAKFVADFGLCGRSDEDVFAAAWREKRILITHDVDFLNDKRFPSHRNAGVILVRPGSDGRDDVGLIGCLAKAVLLAGKNATWFRGKKLDFSSDEALTITSRGTRHRYLWKKHGTPMIWED